MLKIILVIGPTKTACFDIFKKMKFGPQIRLKEAYPGMSTHRPKTFDAVILNLPTEECAKYVTFLDHVPVIAYFNTPAQFCHLPEPRSYTTGQEQQMSAHVQKKVNEIYKRVYQIVTDIDMDAAFGQYINVLDLRAVLKELDIHLDLLQAYNAAKDLDQSHHNNNGRIELSHFVRYVLSGHKSLNEY